MKLALSVLLVFSFLLTKGQNSSALLNEIDSLMEQSQWKQALPKAEQYLQMVTKETGENHLNYLKGLYMSGLIHSGLNNVEKANSWFDKYLQASLKLNGGSSPNYARALNNAGIFKARHRMNKEAVELYVRSLAITEKNSADSGRDYAGTLRNLGLAYIQLKEYAKAESAFKQSAELRKIKPGEQSWDYEQVLYDLAELYYSTGNYKNALPILEKAGSIIKQLAGTGSGDYTFYLNFLGDIYLKLSDIKNAEANYAEAVRLYKEKFGTANADYAVLLLDLATLYARNNRTAEGESLLKEVLAIRKKAVGEEHYEYLESLDALGDYYIRQRRYENALPLYEAGAFIAKKMYGTDNSDYDFFLFNVAYVTDALNEYTKAETTYKEVVALRKKIYGENSRQYALALNNLGVLYTGLNKYENAEPLLAQAVLIRKELLGTDHVDYWQSISNLAKVYMGKRELEKSEALYLQAHNFYEQNKANYKKEYVVSLRRIAILYTDMPGKRESALAWFQNALPKEKELFGELDPMYIDDLTVLGNIYKSFGEYGKAEAQYLQVMKIMLGKPNEKPEFLAKAMNIMGRFYKEYGLYNKADSFFKAATNYTKAAFADNSVPYARALTSEASLHMAAGEYSKAEPLLLQAEALINKISGKRNLDYFTTSLNLALVYQKLSQWEKTIGILDQALEGRSVYGLTDQDLYLQVFVPYLMYGKDYAGVEDMHFAVMKIYRDKGEQNNERFVKLQNDLTDVYLQSQQYEKAQSLITNILQEAPKFLKPNHHEYARAVYNQARLHLYQKVYDKAETGFIRSLELRKESLGINHPDYIMNMRMLGSLHLLKNEYEKGIGILMRTEDLLHENLLKNFTVLSEKEKGKAIEEIMGFHEIMNNAATESPNHPALLQHNLNSTLLLKSLALASTRSMLDAVRNSKDKEVQNLVTQWQDSKNFLGRQYSLPKELRITAIDSLEKRVESLEKELTRRSSDFRNAQGSVVHYRDIQKSMKPDEALVEFVRFAGFKQDEARYGAYLLNKQDSTPKFIPLCFEKDLDKLFARSGKNTTAMVSSLYRGAAGEDENVTVTKGDSLYTLIWKPLEKHLAGIKTISYSPAGKLYTVAFQALPVDNKLLMDKYSLQQYTSTRLIAARNQHSNLKPKTAALFGDAQFNLQPASKSPGNSKDVLITSYVPGNRGSSASAWTSLPGTAEEVKKLRQLFSDNAISTQIFTQQQSSEEALKELSAKAPQVLHIATHGFFLPENKKETIPTGNVYATAEDPLLRSGLVLSGANHVWTGKPPVQGVEDGIATAYEISQIDLAGTELVVLSACETALGAVQGSEGVFGLQRGFKMAGAKKMIVSLWQVPDKETAELMTLFYTTWLTGKPIAEAFGYAQSEMRKKYSPFYWAAFVMVE